MKPRTDRIIITCEHGGNRIPRSLVAAFRPLRSILATHRAWDPGALDLARQFARTLHAPVFVSTVSRLVVDLNRSEHHPRVFSTVTRALPAKRRDEILDTRYRPFRADVLAAVAHAIGRGKKVVHISVHSFTPVLAGVRRSADIGLLYDPSRRCERDLAAAWRRAILRLDPSLRVRMNYPYRGTADGHTTSLRGRFPARWYIGIELEINQAIVRAGGRRWGSVRSILTAALVQSLRRERRKSPGK